MRNWIEEYEITTSIAVDTWTAWNRNEALATGSTYVGLQIYSWIIYRRSYLEAANCTVTLGTDVPTYNTTIFTQTPKTTYSVTATITNSTTGDAIQIDFQGEENQALEIDTDVKTITDLSDNSSQLSALTLTGGARRDWLKLQPGDNVLEFSDEGTEEMIMEIWFDRRYWE